MYIAHQQRRGIIFKGNDLFRFWLEKVEINIGESREDHLLVQLKLVKAQFQFILPIYAHFLVRAAVIFAHFVVHGGTHIHSAGNSF